MENDENIFDSDHHGKGPDYDGQDSNEVIVAGFFSKGGGVHVERTGPNVAVDYTNRLIGKPQQKFSVKDLVCMRSMLLRRVWSCPPYLSGLVVIRPS
jgi:hypothetical protein